MSQPWIIAGPVLSTPRYTLHIAILFFHFKILCRNVILRMHTIDVERIQKSWWNTSIWDITLSLSTWLSIATLLKTHEVLHSWRTEIVWLIESDGTQRNVSVRSIHYIVELQMNPWVDRAEQCSNWIVVCFSLLAQWSKQPKLQYQPVWDLIYIIL